MRSRPPTVTVAAVVLALSSVLFNLAFPLWANAVPRGGESVPAIVVFLAVGVGVAGLAAAAGLWLLRRWGVWLTLVVCVLSVLDARGAWGGRCAERRVAGRRRGGGRGLRPDRRAGGAADLAARFRRFLLSFREGDFLLQRFS